MHNAKDMPRPKKSLGQNFLVDEDIAARIVDAADIGPENTVVEIGPGHGAMTRDLARHARRLIAVELDDRLYLRLKEEFSALGNVEVVHADALKYPYEDLPCRVKVVANLPYYISTPIISRLIEAREKVALMVLMLQKEVAERITAPPGGKDYGYLSVMVQLYADAEVLFNVPPGAFKPVPKVDSAVVRLTMFDRPKVECRDYALFERVVSAAFSKRRKTLRNSLKGALPVSEEGVARMAESGVDPIRRAETLSVAEFGLLSDFLTDFLFEFRQAR